MRILGTKNKFKTDNLNFKEKTKMLTIEITYIICFLFTF